VPPSEANFVWLRLGQDTMDFADACDKAGLAVRPFAGEGVRVSIGEKAANNRFIEVAREEARHDRAGRWPGGLR